MQTSGKLIVIDGPDATGKKTQADLLEKRMREKNLPVTRIAFPRYSEDSSYLVRLYLGREKSASLGTPKEVGSYFASIFYAFDRRAAAPEMRRTLREGTHIICDRYVTANMGHQGGLIADDAERREYWKWIHEFEYGICGLPKPNCTIFLHVPLDIAMRLLETRLHQARLFGEGENDSLDEITLQKKARGAFEELTKLYRNEFTLVECAEDDATLQSPEAIHEKIWKVVQPILS